MPIECFSRLRQEEFNILGSKIIGLFPTETLGVYYCPPIKKSENPFKKSVMAKGKLVNQMRNILFRSGDTVARRSEKRKIEDLEGDRRVVPRNDNTGSDSTMFWNILIRILFVIETQNEDILWLKHNYEPWSTVLEKWKNTYQFRILNTAHTVEEYFKCWPILNDPRAHVLVCYIFPDFQTNAIGSVVVIFPRGK